MYDKMAPFVRAEADRFENDQMFSKVKTNDEQLLAKYKPGKKSSLKKIRKALTRYSVDTAQEQFANWAKLEETLLVKFIDGNIKAQEEDGSFSHSEYNEGTPKGLQYGGYNDLWKKVVAQEHGSVIEQK